MRSVADIEQTLRLLELVRIISDHLESNNPPEETIANLRRILSNAADEDPAIRRRDYRHS